MFEDGTTASGTLIVGADGANSKTRSSVFAAPAGEAQQIPYGGINMHVCFRDASTARYLRECLSPIVALAVHPRGYWLWLSIQDVPDPDEPENWVFQLQWTWKQGPETASLAQLNLEELQNEAKSVFGEPLKTAWTMIPDGARVAANKISVWTPQPIPREAFEGKVALVGDAAHAMSFHRGQGLNHGIADACKIVEVLTKVKEGSATQKEAVLEYESEMVRRAGEEVAVSRKNTEMVHVWEQFKHSPFMQRGADKNS